MTVGTDRREVIVELRVSYDAGMCARVFPTMPGSMSVGPDGDLDSDPPIEAREQLVFHLAATLSGATLTDEALRECEVDILTVDCRSAPPPPPDSEPDVF